MLEFFNISKSLMYFYHKKKNLVPYYLQSMSPKSDDLNERQRTGMRKIILCGTLSIMINFAHAMDDNEGNKKSTYVLQTGKQGAERLNLQQDFLSEASNEHLRKAGLSRGKIVLDVGCGNGAMIPHLAEEVGEEGHVYAIEMSEKQIELAKEKVKSKGLKNVTFIQGDIRSLKECPEKADIAYIRYVLMHVPDPGRVLTQVKNLMKPGGFIALQEPIMSTSQYKDMGEYSNTILALGEKMKVDYDIGKKLEDLCRKAGYVNPVVSYRRPTAEMPVIKHMLCLGLNEWKNKAIGEKITTQEKVEEWERIIKSWPDIDTDSSYLLPEQAYLIGRKEN